MKNLFVILTIGLFGCTTSSEMSCCESKSECVSETTWCEMDHCDKTKCEGNCCDISCCG